MRVELMQSHFKFGPFSLAADVDELPNGDLMIGALEVGFPEDSCTPEEQHAFVAVEAVALRKRLGREWFRLKGLGPADMKLIAFGNGKGAA